MRKIFLALIALLVVLSTSSCSARSVSVTELEDFFGDWYDSKGNLVLAISSDYRINGCIILSVDFDGTDYFTIRIAEKNGHRDIKMGGCGNPLSNRYFDSSNAYHRMIVVDDKIVLRDSKRQKYVESVGGIYLGMDKDQVLSFYGRPSSKDENRNCSTWKYNNLGLEVNFRLNIVTGITIYPYGNIKFDWSGLSAKSSSSDFEYKYNASMTGRGNIDIGHGELICINKIRFGNNGVYLGIFTPGYVF